MTSTCTISVRTTAPIVTTMGAIQRAPFGHPSYELPMSVTNLICQAQFSGAEPSCGKSTGFDTNYTIGAVSTPDLKANEAGKKILFAAIVKDVLQNDPCCPRGAYTDPALFEMMKYHVLNKLNYDLRGQTSTHQQINWVVNVTEDLQSKHTVVYE